MTDQLPASDCAGPLDEATLMDYWLAALSDAEEERVEEHLMMCDRCGDRLREVMALAGSLHELARLGGLQVVVSDELIAHAAASGRRVREYAVQPGESVQCTVSADDDFLVARLAVDLTGAQRVDLSWCDIKGDERVRMTDIAVRPDAASVICQQSIVWGKGSPSATMTARLLSVDADGRERTLGQYTFVHTRTIPGPPEWTA